MSDMKCPFCKEEIISDLCFLFDKKDKDYTSGRQIYKCNKCGLFGTKELWQELIRTRKALDKATKENKDKQAVLNCVVDMLKTLNQRYALIMGKDVIKETVRLLEQKDVK